MISYKYGQTKDSVNKALNWFFERTALCAQKMFAHDTPKTKIEVQELHNELTRREHASPNDIHAIRSLNQEVK